jgi:hypothetical protein
MTRPLINQFDRDSAENEVIYYDRKSKKQEGEEKE